MLTPTISPTAPGAVEKGRARRHQPRAAAQRSAVRRADRDLAERGGGADLQRLQLVRRMEVRVPRLHACAAPRDDRAALGGAPRARPERPEHHDAGANGRHQFRATVCAWRDAALGHQLHSAARPGRQLPGLGLHQHALRALDPAQFRVRQLARDRRPSSSTPTISPTAPTQPAGEPGHRSGVPHRCAFPDAFGDYGGLTWNIGSFPNRYGTAGKYDAGMYETYQFGRTHVSGETLTATLSNLDDGRLDRSRSSTVSAPSSTSCRSPTIRIIKSSAPTRRPARIRTARPILATQSADYLPWAGPVPQGSTYLHHAHIGRSTRRLWNFGLHYLFTWTPDDNWDPRNSRLMNSLRRGPALPGPGPGQHGGPGRGGELHRRRVR